MGGAVAVALASQLRHARDYGALILESSFTRMPDVAAQAGFWGRLAASITSLEFDALSRVGRIDAPLLMLHGSADNTVPVALGRRLRDAARPGVRWVEFPGGTHSRLHSEAPVSYTHLDVYKRQLLYLHGTFRHLGQNLPKIDALREAGFAVLAVDYRGWGESAAIVPTEDSIHADAAVAWEEPVSYTHLGMHWHRPCGKPRGPGSWNCCVLTPSSPARPWSARA